MKPITANPSDTVMKFFTPELYIRVNSDDDEVADRADEDWEAALREYRRHFKQLSGRMPAQLKNLAKLCLHDAEFLTEAHTNDPIVYVPVESPHASFGLAFLSVKLDEQIISLTYVLSDRIGRHPWGETWPFSRLRPYWLYDEIDVATNERGTFLHRILISDGVQIEIPFSSVLIHRIPLQGVDVKAESRQIA